MSDRVAYIAAALALAFCVGLLTGRAEAAAEQPHCPSEDSCRPDYRDGRWHIIELQPWEI